MSDPCREIYLSRGFVTIVDGDEFDKLLNIKWVVNIGKNGKPYATSGWGATRKIMHRFIVEAPIGMLVDHINGNTLDNRKSNLRICTNAENVRNSAKRSTNISGFKGVNWQNGKWMARITANRKQYNLGSFSTPEEAHAAYCEKAKELHGEFARFE